MKKENIINTLEELKIDLQDALFQADQMWKNQVPHARIVGYLEGYIKAVLIDIDGVVKK